MIKNNLSAIILKGIILLLSKDIRLEFTSNESKNIIDVSELFHDNEMLIVSTTESLEKPDVSKLPKIGEISKISHKMELQNGKTKVIIKGTSRAQIYEYLKLNNNFEVIESIVSNIEEENIGIKE